jgi:hypothetical protein
VTLKSGDLVVESTIIIGRSGSTTSAQNIGRVNQLGGSFRTPIINLDIGQREPSGWGNGIWDYRGGVFEVGLQSVFQGANLALRLSHGGSQGTGGVGRFIMRNPASGGRVRVWDLSVASHAGIDEGTTGPDGSIFNPALDPDGFITGVGILEFHYRSARLDLQLDSAVAFKSGTIPIDLALVDVDFDDLDPNTTDDSVAGIINGTGSIGQFFSKADASANYTQGSVVSAIFGNTTYNWTISYTGNITYNNTADANNSIVASISAIDGNDVVLIGQSSMTTIVDDADFDGNGRVDGKDFLIWQSGFGGPGTNATGDANGDGNVNAADHAIWKTQFGNPFPASGSLTGVPEPGSLVLLGTVALALVPRRRRSG